MNQKGKTCPSGNLLTRREALKRISWLGAGLAGASIVSWPPVSKALAKETPSGVLVEGLGQSRGYSVLELTRKVFEAAGGMKQFVSKGDVVILKPNISWARAPGLAATTNPEVLEAVVILCQEAGAKKVRIADHTIHDARRCFTVTGAGAVAERTNAELIYPLSSLMRDMKIQGHRLEVWPVFVPFKEADKIINIPVAKVHSSSRLTLGMKNWLGGVGGRRNALHQDIHQSIVDLAQFFRPTVTLIDATRVMIHNGPSGGSEEDVAVKNCLILGTDPVAVDAKATALFGMKPEDVGFIQLGAKWGLGTFDLTTVEQRQVTL